MGRFSCTLGCVLDCEACERLQSAFVIGVRQYVECIERGFRFAPCEARRIVEPAARLDRADDRLELREAAPADRLPNQLPFRLTGELERMDKRQGRLALGEIVPQVLAALGGIRAKIEYIVDELIRRAEMPSVARQAALRVAAARGEHRGNFCTGLEQTRSLAIDH